MSRLKSARQAFAIQYLSLILIILCFLVGFLGSKKLKDSLEPGQEIKDQKVAIHIPQFLESRIPLQNVFNETDDSVDSSAFEALKEVLENHNLDLSLEITAKDRISSRVIDLAKVLNSQGFWKDSYTINGVIDPTLHRTQVSARFNWSAK